MAHIEGKGRTGEVDRRAKMQGVTVLVGTIGASIGCSFHQLSNLCLALNGRTMHCN